MSAESRLKAIQLIGKLEKNKKMALLIEVKMVKKTQKNIKSP